MRPGEALEHLSREQLLELITAYSRNWLAMDGVWFQSIERKFGMDEAMYHDIQAWQRFTVTEARRIKKFLDLPDRPGLPGLKAALGLRFMANLCHYEFEEGEHTLTLRNLDCRVQTARLDKGMPLHPCKPAGEAEYSGFARTIDDRIRCQCISCCPDVTDDTCACAWRFTLEE